MVNKWALVCTPSIVPTFGDQIYLFIMILHGYGTDKKTIKKIAFNK
jgi:hypothetical protein